MKTSSILVLAAIATVIISILCIWSAPSKQGFTNTNASWNGMRDWRARTTAVDVSSLNTLPALPQDQVIVIIPNTPYQRSEMAQMRDFVSEGGYLVLLDDYGYGNDILSYLGVIARFTNKTVLDPLFYYKSPALPRITDFSPFLEKSGIKSIVLNHATTFTGVDDADVLAWSSKESFLDSNGNGQYDAGETKGPFPIAARFMFDKGTITIFTDQSIMINSMLNLEDNYAMVKYLTASPAEQPLPILVDTIHLELGTLDKSKVELHTIREFLATPYPLTGLVAIIFVLVYRYGFKKGELLG